MNDGCITTEYVTDYDPIVRIAELELKLEKERDKTSKIIESYDLAMTRLWEQLDEARKLAEEWRDCACLIHKEGGFWCRPTWPGGLPWEEK